ncbi:Co2+/Mg2+ efflux protein ApaG [Deinococcus pimensis]|uniref:Co2+/Mg2+ efflux protein ApaG n=1 Tax=Deinococcus pimensis TaxID=309888 RepID=UPI0004872EF7|nr:Co2+/Mg2+ efflux protein ApaG [Deinococcus pimensis]
MTSLPEPDIRVVVKAAYVDTHSREGHHVFVYLVRIENHAEESYKLLEREWKVTDGEGQVTRVAGVGVVGEQPLLAPGAVFQYDSSVVVGSIPGRMEGSYVFQDAWGERRRVMIPAFALDRPTPRVLN